MSLKYGPTVHIWIFLRPIWDKKWYFHIKVRGVSQEIFRSLFGRLGKNFVFLKWISMYISTSNFFIFFLIYLRILTESIVMFDQATNSHTHALIRSFFWNVMSVNLIDFQKKNIGSHLKSKTVIARQIRKLNTKIEEAFSNLFFQL